MRLSVRTALMALGCMVLAAGCVSGNKIRADGEVIQADIERARKSGAYRCAPRELAMAEAHLDFAYGEVSEGNSTRAQDHVRTAEENIKKALVLSKDCGPKQVLIKEKKEPVVVKIEPTDRDKDGVLDADDECIDIPGPVENRGCPYGDRDNDTVIDPEDRCPDVPGLPENQGCPVVKDTDADGIPDDLDRCPLDPEDRDGYQDEDGCPDLDNDKDGIPDTQDACPLEPGIADADPAKNGCPRKMALVVVKKDRIEIKQQINFQFGKAKIRGKQSCKVIDEVVTVLKDYPSIKKIRIEGHTDSVGKAASNMKLSQARAESVVEYLIEQGIEASRLEAVGFGLTKPIASNATAKGRAQNRRTEFNIVERE